MAFGFKRKVVATEQPVKHVRSGTPSEIEIPLWDEFGTSEISVVEALNIPEVAAAHRIITTAVSQLGMTVERQGSEIDSPLVTRPDNNRSQSSFFKRTTTDLALYGNCYWRIFRDSQGIAVDMKVLDPNRVAVRYDDKGNKFYEYAGANGTETLSNNSPTVNGQVEHIKLAELPGYILGLGPIQMNNSALVAIRNQRAYYDAFLADAKRPSGIYSFDDHLDEEEMDHALETIKSKFTTGEPIVLSKGAKYESIMFNAEQAALVEMKDAATLDVARIFGIPPHKLAGAVNGNSMTYQNVGQADRAWVREGLEEYLTAIEDAMTNVLPRGQVAQFDVDNWLRAAEAIQTKEAAPAAQTE